MTMSKENLLISIEVIINESLKRLSKLEGKEKISLHDEFREWIDAIESDEKEYDVLYINKINNI